MMHCPSCGSEHEMAYSALFHGFVCMEPECGFEIEMDPESAQQVLAPEEELVCC
jgi:hypothetical protein